MSNERIRPGLAAQAAFNLGLAILALLAWGWLDYRYIHEHWTPGEMRAATDWLMLGIIAGSMLANLWLLRRQSLLGHTLGAVIGALAVLTLWWVTISLAGNAFHVAIGGDAAP